jgi:elongation factor Ts
MSTISAAQVKELRERTGAGMMECKKALVASGGDMERAIEELRKSGITKAGKKADRIAAEGVIAISENGKQAVMVEINSETDFVARDSHFTAFVKAVVETALNAQIHDVAELATHALTGADKTVEEARQELVAKVGENVQIRRLVLSQIAATCVGTYLHGNRIGVIVELDVDNKELARDIAMHIAASKPLVILPEHVPADLIAKEKEIYIAQASTSGKPPEIIEKMVAGRLKKYLDEVSLYGQPFVKDPDLTVGSLLNKYRAKVLAFYRYEVGEGIEKVSEDFKSAVMSQVKGS